MWPRAMLSVGSYLNRTGWGWRPEQREEAGLGTHSRPTSHLSPSPPCAFSLEENVLL